MNRTLCTLLFAGAIAAAYASPDQVKQELTGVYTNLSAAFAAKDLGPYKKVLAPDFVVVDLKGRQMHRDQILKSYKSQMAMMNRARWERSITSVKRAKADYVTTVSSTISAFVKGGDGKEHSLKILAAAEDTWTKSGTNWVIRKSKLLKMSAMMDGHVVGAN